MEEKLDIKIGSKKEAFWTQIKTNCEANILNMTEGLLIENSTLKLAKEKILEEKWVTEKGNA